MNDFLKRTLTGAGFVTVLLGSVLLGEKSFMVLFFFITLGGVWEFYRLAEKGENKPQKTTGMLLAATLYFSSAALASGLASDPRILAAIIPLLFGTFIVELYTQSKNPFRNVGFTILGVVYIALPFSLLNFVVFRDGAYDYRILLGLLFILWSNDTFAYLSGMWLGRRKLFERVSPKKSWEGSIGGAMAGFACAYVISLYFETIRPVDWMAIALIVVVIGTLGDLVESLYKRSKNVKDSGTLLPGHGGILDRFDSLLLALPFVFTYLVVVR